MVLETKYVDKSAINKTINLVVILKNEVSGQILYWRNYLNPEKLVGELKKKHKYKKIEELY